MAHRAPLVLAQHSAEWPKKFEAERALLARAFENSFCVIEHIGSTAVPCLLAKPIIDIMIGVRSLADVTDRLASMEHLGYEYMPQHELAMPERRFFARPLIRPRHFHVHVVVLGGPFWNDHLLFRDALRSSPPLAQSYASLKLRLAAQFGEDREGYTNAKTDFIASVVRGARMVQTAPSTAMRR